MENCTIVGEKVLIIKEIFEKKGFTLVDFHDGYDIDDKLSLYLVFNVNYRADDLFFINSVYKNFPSQAWKINRYPGISDKGDSRISVVLRELYMDDITKIEEAFDFLLSFADNLANVYDLK